MGSKLNPTQPFALLSLYILHIYNIYVGKDLQSGVIYIYTQVGLVFPGYGSSSVSSQNIAWSMINFGNKEEFEKCSVKQG